MVQNVVENKKKMVISIAREYGTGGKEIARKIAQENDCVIVGREADYILKEEANLIRIFLYAPLEYRINKIQEMYNDNYKDAKSMY